MTTNCNDIHSSQTLKQGHYRPEIDGLRAFAVAAVIINHFNKDILPGGYLGVDIFFVISGYVITASLLRKPSKDFRDFISGFYERRIKRLFPALSVFVIIASIAICLFNPSPRKSLLTGLTSLVGLSNLALFKSSTDYFAQSTELNIFMHTWSLGVEEQFYILFPILSWFSGYGRQTKNGARNLFLVTGTLTIASLVGFLYLYPKNQPAAYFLMPSRFWEMASGCLIFIGFDKRKSIKQCLEKVPPFLVLTLIIGVMYLPMSMASSSTITVVALASILITCLRKQTAAFKIFTHPKVVYIGLISYSLYLWHWGVLSISRWTIGIHWWSAPLQAALILILAVASYRWIETPLRKGNWFGKRWKTFVAGGGLLVAISGGLAGLSGTLNNRLFTGDRSIVWNTKEFRTIRMVNDLKFPTIYLIGDSHAGHYGAVMTQLVHEKTINLIMHSRGYGLDINHTEQGGAKSITGSLSKYINDFKEGDIVIFSAVVDKYEDKNSNWLRSYKLFIDATKNKGLHYFIVSPTPVFPENLSHAVTCTTEFYRPRWLVQSNNCLAEIVKSNYLEMHKKSYSNLFEFIERHSGVEYINTLEAICPDPICYNYDNNFLYKDNNHLSSYGSTKTKDIFNQLIERYLPHSLR